MPINRAVLFCIPTSPQLVASVCAEVAQARLGEDRNKNKNKSKNKNGRNSKGDRSNKREQGVARGNKLP